MLDNLHCFKLSRSAFKLNRAFGYAVKILADGLFEIFEPKLDVSRVMVEKMGIALKQKLLIEIQARRKVSMMLI